jgi:hypothetical protein
MEHVTIYTCKNKGLEYYEREHPRKKELQKVYFDKYSHRRFVFRKCNKKKKILCKHIDENVSEPQFCESTAQFGGLCLKHGDRTCAKEGCNNPQHTGEFCQTHSPNRCGEEGCDNPSHKEGFCMKHHPNRCAQDGCDNAVSTHGFCQKHSPNRCEEEGCDNAVHSGGLCQTHAYKCKHERFKDICYDCSKKRHLFCTICRHLLSKNRRTGGIKICKTCECEEKRIVRLETQYKDILISWGYYPSIVDKIIRGSDCKIINLRRVDYFYLLQVSFPYNILVECDENNHSHELVSCEFKRLQLIHDQIIANTSDCRPLVVVRFNPNYGDQEYLKKELRSALEDVFAGNIECNDARGVNLYPKLIGYSEKRKQKYEEEPLSKRIQLDYIQE